MNSCGVEELSIFMVCLFFEGCFQTFMYQPLNTGYIDFNFGFTEDLSFLFFFDSTLVIGPWGQTDYLMPCILTNTWIYKRYLLRIKLLLFITVQLWMFPVFFLFIAFSLLWWCQSEACSQGPHETDAKKLSIHILYPFLQVTHKGGWWQTRLHGLFIEKAASY